MSINELETRIAKMQEFYLLQLHVYHHNLIHVPL